MPIVSWLLGQCDCGGLKSGDWPIVWFRRRIWTASRALSTSPSTSGARGTSVTTPAVWGASRRTTPRWRPTCPRSSIRRITLRNSTDIWSEWVPLKSWTPLNLLPKKIKYFLFLQPEINPMILFLYFSLIYLQIFRIIFEEYPPYILKPPKIEFFELVNLIKLNFSSTFFNSFL